jgi:beta-mannanase
MPRNAFRMGLGLLLASFLVMGSLPPAVGQEAVPPAPDGEIQAQAEPQVADDLGGSTQTTRAPDPQAAPRWLTDDPENAAQSDGESPFMETQVVPPSAVVHDPDALLPDGDPYWGIWIDNAPFDMAALTTFETKVKKKVSILHFGEAWQNGSGGYLPFQAFAFQRVRDHGAIPLVDWFSWRCCNATSNMNLAEVYNGKHDAHIRTWATAAKNWGHPFMLRFDAEQNGWWLPWSEQTNGNKPGDYVKAWRHVHDIFHSVGANNVYWVWCPNIAGSKSTPMASMYPGGNYVDWTCLDGYNWGTRNGNKWQTFAQVFGGEEMGGYRGQHNSYKEILSIAPDKPLMIGETASSEQGGSKAGWIKDALEVALPRTFPQIKALVWFNEYEDWSVTTSASAVDQFAKSIQSSYYEPNVFGSINEISTLTNPLPAQMAAAEAAPDPTTAVASSGVTLNAVADTSVWSSCLTCNGGRSAEIQTGGTTDYSYLRFDLSSLAGKTITGATLKLHSTTQSYAAPGGTYDVKVVGDTAWAETAPTYSSRPAIGSTILGTLAGPQPVNTWHSVSLNASAMQTYAGKLLSVAIVGRGTDVFRFYARESGANGPQLVVAYRGS